MGSLSPEPRFSLGKSLLYSTLIVGGFFALAELGLRLVGVPQPPRPRLLLRLLDVDIDFPFMRPDPETFWSLRPGYRGEFLGQQVSVNSLGLRGAEVAARKPAGRRRLLLFGDSITFGYGVGDDQTYAYRLGALAGGRGLETVNAGVTGFTSYQVGAWLRRTLGSVAADYASFCIGWNDGTQRPTADRDYARRLERLTGVESALSRLYLFRATQGVLARAAVRSQREAAWQTPRVPLEEYRQNLRAMARDCRAHGVRPAFLALPHRKRAGEPPASVPYAAALREVARELDIPVLEIGVLAADAPVADTSELFVDTLHLSPAGHDYLARELERQLAALGWI